MKANWNEICALIEKYGAKIVFSAALLSAMIFLLAELTACTVTRTITNESQYLQKGDTSVVIQTKTIEQYNGQKNK